MTSLPKVELIDTEALAIEYGKFAAFIESSKELKDMREDVRGLLSPCPRDVVFEEHSVTLYHYQPLAKTKGRAKAKTSAKAKAGRPLLIIPSLVNKPFVMDMLKGQSFVEAMLERGLDVYMLEWGEPTLGQRDLTLEYYLNHYIERAVRRTMKRAGSDGVDMAGYCLGGTLALLYAALDKGEKVKSLVTMVSPFNFHDESMLSWWAKKEHLDVDMVVDTYGNVPADFFAQAFPLLVPQANLTKLRLLYEHNENSEFMVGFLALDIWGRENTAFPGEVYRSLIRHGYQENVLVEQGLWPVESGKLSLKDVVVPCLNLAAEYDHIAPAASCTVLTSLLPNSDCTSRSYPTTHLGFALGKDVLQNSVKDYWDDIGKWLSSHQ